jgi:hypothetical protein
MSPPSPAGPLAGVCGTRAIYFCCNEIHNIKQYTTAAVIQIAYDVTYYCSRRCLRDTERECAPQPRGERAAGARRSRCLPHTLPLPTTPPPIRPLTHQPAHPRDPIDTQDTSPRCTGPLPRPPPRPRPPWPHPAAAAHTPRRRPAFGRGRWERGGDCLGGGGVWPLLTRRAAVVTGQDGRRSRGRGGGRRGGEGVRKQPGRPQ